jgi:hypothetical protein
MQAQSDLFGPLPPPHAPPPQWRRGGRAACAPPPCLAQPSLARPGLARPGWPVAPPLGRAVRPSPPPTPAHSPQPLAGRAGLASGPAGAVSPGGDAARRRQPPLHPSRFRPASALALDPALQWRDPAARAAPPARPPQLQPQPQPPAAAARRSRSSCPAQCASRPSGSASSSGPLPWAGARGWQRQEGAAVYTAAQGLRGGLEDGKGLDSDSDSPHRWPARPARPGPSDPAHVPRAMVQLQARRPGCTPAE